MLGPGPVLNLCFQNLYLKYALPARPMISMSFLLLSIFLEDVHSFHIYCLEFGFCRILIKWIMW